jgi:CheY-like chemotaxis protein
MRQKVLVIDDDDIVRELITSILEAAGYAAISLSSPLGATQALLREEIDVLILDVMMPELRGDKLVTLLRSNRRLKDLVVVLVSSEPVEKLAELAVGVGAHNFVNKRNLRAQLVHAVKSGRPLGAIGRPLPG